VIWIILAALGIPLWMLAGALALLFSRARSLREREGDLSVRVRRQGAKRWTKGHAIWVHDVFAFDATMLVWVDVLLPVSAATVGPVGAEDQHALRRLDAPVVASLVGDDGQLLEVAATGSRADGLLGPFVTA